MDRLADTRSPVLRSAPLAQDSRILSGSIRGLSLWLGHPSYLRSRLRCYEHQPI